MTGNTRRARARAIAEAKPNARMVTLRYLMLAAGATAASLALLLSHLI
ncbi:hypothetical protein GGE16_000522 [Rhizobium leguminosarum]|uniref:Uncharacterized protein n=1 Tax=Rhizobium leguminosarum TaxID=384 RepID=A0AAE2SUD6_RHILE|nr:MULTISPECIES: hypothetical protein [Rhizobium]MBB4288506.1 hypothetical protein [Rhizobium leguminosarum]MBB4295401.1 hypothetical protein [Rhizobium leguminosarum]MBB4306795.1 hypothetical protein [Rhizobium leguminosarum]MBB4417623.1 hypothetical protein [Rhizobium leguminosarum]MBB4432468.1 hypothetical protein [Rhizobium esperanzae]